MIIKLECPYCTYTTNSNDYIQRVKEHLGGKTFRCILCNAIYKYRGDCVVHLKRKHQKSDLIAQNYVQLINIEDKDVNDVYSLLKPKMYDDIDNEDKLFGYYCDYKANYKGDVYKHQTWRHPGTDKNVRILNQAAANASITDDDQPLSQQHNDDETTLNYDEDDDDDDDDNDEGDKDDDDEVDGGGINGVGVGVGNSS
jgi:hypothetical protein